MKLWVKGEEKKGKFDTKPKTSRERTKENIKIYFTF